MLLFVGCWQPGDYIPPVPENLAFLNGPDGSTEADPAPQEGEPADAAEGEVEAGSATPDPPEEEPAAPPSTAPAAAVEPYAAQTVGAPLTLVDDRGNIVQVLAIPQMDVIVLAEEPPVRKKVRCSACTPEVEGWLQFKNVERK